MSFPIGNALSLQGVLLVVGHLLGPVAVITYNTARTISRTAIQAMELINNSVWPEISSAFGAGDLSLAKRLHRRSCQLSIFVSLTIIFGGIVAGPYLWRHWTMGKIPIDPVLLNILLLQLLFAAFWYTSSVTLAATNRHQGFAKIYLASTGFALTSAWIIVQYFHLGLRGVAGAMVCGEIVTASYVLRASLKLVEDTPSEFFRSMLKPVNLRQYTYGRLAALTTPTILNNQSSRMSVPEGNTTNRIAWLDSLRGVAVLGVILVHSGQVARSSGVLGNITSMGRYGVQLFFVISAITISLTYDKHVKQYGSSLKVIASWLLKRLFRIAPLYYLAAIFYTCLQAVLFRHLGPTVAQKPSFWNFVANILFIHAWIPSANNSVVPGGWSIGVEAMFYLLFPVVMIIHGRKYFYAVLSTICIGSLVLSEAVARQTTGTFHIANDSFLYYWFPTEFPVIAIGCICFFLFVIGKANKPFPRSPIILVIFIALFGAGAALGSWGDFSPGLAPVVFGFAFCCLCLFLRGVNHGPFAKGLLSNIGTCSYSMYLVHFVLLTATTVALRVLHVVREGSGLLLLSAVYIPVVIAAYLISTQTRRWIELPGIALGHKLSERLLPERQPIAHQ